MVSFFMSEKKLKIIKRTLEDLSEYYGNNGCNDLYIEDCEENRKSVEEYNLSIEDDSPLRIIDGKILTYDFFGIYLIKKELNL